MTAGRVRPAAAEDGAQLGAEFVAEDNRVLCQNVLEIARASRRWCPIWSRWLALQASVSVLMLLGGLCASGYRIYVYEQATTQQLRAAAAEHGQRALGEFSRRYRTAATSTLTLAAVVEHDAGSELLGPNPEELIRAAQAEAAGGSSSAIQDALGPFGDDPGGGQPVASSGAGQVVEDSIVGLEDVPPEIREAILRAIRDGSAAGGVVIVHEQPAPVQGSELEAVNEQISQGDVQLRSWAPFLDVGASFIAAHEGIRSMQLAPMGLVAVTCCGDLGRERYGVDLFHDPDVGEVLNASLAGERWTLGAVGPMNGTGGLVLLVHCPVFIKARPGISFVGMVKDHPTYWGSILVEVELPRLLNGTSLATLHDRGYSFVLSSDSPRGPVLWAASADVPGQPLEALQDPSTRWSNFANGQHPVEVSMSLEGLPGPVRLLVWPSAEWKEHSDSFALQLVLSGLLFVLSVATFYVGLLRQSVLSHIRGIAKRFTEAHAELQRRYAISP